MNDSRFYHYWKPSSEVEKEEKAKKAKDNKWNDWIEVKECPIRNPFRRSIGKIKQSNLKFDTENMKIFEKSDSMFDMEEEANITSTARSNPFTVQAMDDSARTLYKRKKIESMKELLEELISPIQETFEPVQEWFKASQKNRDIEETVYVDQAIETLVTNANILKGIDLLKIKDEQTRAKLKNEEFPIGRLTGVQELAADLSRELNYAIMCEYVPMMKRSLIQLERIVTATRLAEYDEESNRFVQLKSTNAEDEQASEIFATNVSQLLEEVEGAKTVAKENVDKYIKRITMLKDIVFESLEEPSMDWVDDSVDQMRESMEKWKLENFLEPIANCFNVTHRVMLLGEILIGFRWIRKPNQQLVSREGAREKRARWMCWSLDKPALAFDVDWSVEATEKVVYGDRYWYENLEYKRVVGNEQINTIWIVDVKKFVAKEL
jgi:hypothetical protein